MPNYDLCIITRNVSELGRSHLEVARAALEGGARFLQLRDKELATRELIRVAEELRVLTREFGATFVVNDRVDVAQAVGADGAHVGEEDMPLEMARRVLGPEARLGASVANVTAARAAEAAGANYLGFGPIFATNSKADAGEAQGLGPLAQIKAAVNLPVLGIGGISLENVTAVIQAGADGAAVISAVTEAEDMVKATAELLRKIREARD